MMANVNGVCTIIDNYFLELKQRRAKIPSRFFTARHPSFMKNLIKSDTFAKGMIYARNFPLGKQPETEKMERRSIHFAFALWGAACCFALGVPWANAAINLQPITYTTLASQALLDESISSNPVGFTLINNTGVTWTDFHFALETCEGCGISVDDYYGDGVLSPSSGFTTSLDVLSLTILTGNSYQGSFYIENGNETGGQATVRLTGYPTTGGTVAEPTTVALLGLGLAGLGAVRRRRIVR